MGREREQNITREQAIFLAGGLAADIQETQRHIKYVYEIGKDQRGFQTPEEKDIVRKLQKEKDQRIIDLLILRKKADSAVNFPVELEVYPGEQIHAFSMNPARIYVPSDINPLEQYYVKFELSDLRRPGVVTDSIQAQKLLGNTDEIESSDESFLNRTIIELIRIRDMRNGLVQSGQLEKTASYTTIIEGLSQLSADLVTNRLFPMDAGGYIPQGYDIRFSSDMEHMETVVEIARLSSEAERPDDTYLFRIPAQNIVNTLAGRKN